MSIDLGSETVTVTTKDRTWHIDISTELGEDPLIRTFRETVKLNADGSVALRDRPNEPVAVKASQIATTTYGGLTGAELYIAIQAWADGLATAKKNSTGPFAPPA